MEKNMRDVEVSIKLTAMMPVRMLVPEHLKGEALTEHIRKNAKFGYVPFDSNQFYISDHPTESVEIVKVKELEKIDGVPVRKR